MKATGLNGRIGLAVSEARSEGKTSLSELERRSGVNRQTIRRLEQGGVVGDKLATEIGLALLVVDAYSTPPPEPGLDDALVAQIVPTPADAVAEWGWPA